MTDKRDKWLIQHQRKRLLLALKVSVERRREWAKRELALAERQHRTIMYLLASQWLHDIEEEK